MPPAFAAPRRALALACLLALALSLAGCLGGAGKPAVTVEQYTLEYPPPALGGLAALEQGLVVERFSVAQDLNGQAMVYRPSEYQRQVYAQHRWRVNPADLCTDYLLRDLRASGLFKAVFSYQSPGAARFRLEGAVQEFLESDEPAGPRAALSINLTLLDLSFPDLPRRLVFQRTYQESAPMPRVGAAELAQAMSQAFAQFSQKAITDVHQAIKGRPGARTGMDGSGGVPPAGH
ncbi:MAG: membrane integrity-associated transporter subunit PqiC [Desulfarculus sp.]|nr:membrane integrity-associated transporter subunit PqiC [Desulfarculus sp.]